MRWRASPVPMVGDTRTIKKFAWIPTRVSKDVMVWLEFYHIHQVLARGMRCPFWMNLKKEAP